MNKDIGPCEFFLGAYKDLENFHETFFPDNVVYIARILTCLKPTSSQGQQQNKVVFSARLAAARKGGRKIVLDVSHYLAAQSYSQLLVKPRVKLIM